LNPEVGGGLNACACVDGLLKSNGGDVGAFHASRFAKGLALVLVPVPDPIPTNEDDDD
jgi:hypothetical protein